MTEPELLQLIEQAKREGWTDLNLGLEGLTILPNEIAQLTNLRSLDLGANALTTLPDWMAQLTNLHSINLSANNLTALPNWMAQLTNLHSLVLSENELHFLPNWMAQITNLRSLYLRGNNLTALPDWLAQLTNLQSLDLRSNNLTVLPEWLADPQNLPQLSTLQIAKNPLTEPPAEVLGKTLTDEYANADIEAIRSYFRQLQEANVVYFYEAKLLIIGEGGAGKTSLANKLLNPACQLSKAEKSTEGIDILTWEFVLPEEMADDNYQVNIWDFGGQAIYFATHQFFLTKRSVYLLVADTRRQHTDFYNWLRMQETFGGDSAVLLVKNRNRQLGNSFTIENLPQLRERFPNLKEIIELDLNEVPANPGWTDLLHHLKDYLLRLDHIGQPRPATWVAVRHAIDLEHRDVITWNDFVVLCWEKGMKREADIQLLGEYLHNLGDILYFHEDAVLCDYVILKPTWGLDAVYKVLDNPQIIEQLGQFNRKDLRQLWSDAKYQGYQTQLLRLMENFQLCYPLAEVKDTYIAPQLLTEEPPNYAWDSNENLQLRYVYPIFMPRGILSRAIVKLHQRIEAQRLVWRSGVILNDGYARAEVLELRGDQQIRIRISGRNKRDLLMEIVRALDDLHLGFPKLQFERRIPCNCESCQQRSEPHFYAWEKLLERLSHRKETIECQLPPYHEVAIREMLDEFGDLRGNIRKRGEIWDRIDELQARSIVINEINTGGGHYVGGDVDAGGDFVGRDKS
ncbi:MAG: COR domain-containing protein [Caldilineaceae bacterium]